MDYSEQGAEFNVRKVAGAKSYRHWAVVRSVDSTLRAVGL